VRGRASPFGLVRREAHVHPRGQCEHEEQSDQPGHGAKPVTMRPSEPTAVGSWTKTTPDPDGGESTIDSFKGVKQTGRRPYFLRAR
jgi:hypothetical protein